MLWRAQPGKAKIADDRARKLHYWLPLASVQPSSLFSSLFTSHSARQIQLLEADLWNLKVDPLRATSDAQKGAYLRLINAMRDDGRLDIRQRSDRLLTLSRMRRSEVKHFVPWGACLGVETVMMAKDYVHTVLRRCRRSASVRLAAPDVLNCSRANIHQRLQRYGYDTFDRDHHLIHTFAGWAEDCSPDHDSLRSEADAVLLDALKRYKRHAYQKYRKALLAQERSDVEMKSHTRSKSEIRCCAQCLSTEVDKIDGAWYCNVCEGPTQLGSEASFLDQFSLLARTPAKAKKTHNVHDPDNMGGALTSYIPSWRRGIS